jgi:hypothetical protein
VAVGGYHHAVVERDQVASLARECTGIACRGTPAAQRQVLPFGERGQMELRPASERIVG